MPRTSTTPKTPKTPQKLDLVTFPRLIRGAHPTDLKRIELWVEAERKRQLKEEESLTLEDVELELELHEEEAAQ